MKILVVEDNEDSRNVLALTSYAMKGNKERILEAGCDGYLAKPFDIQEVLKEVAKYLLG